MDTLSGQGVFSAPESTSTHTSNASPAFDAFPEPSEYEEGLLKIRGGVSSPQFTPAHDAIIIPAADEASIATSREEEDIADGRSPSHYQIDHLKEPTKLENGSHDLSETGTTHANDVSISENDIFNKRSNGVDLLLPSAHLIEAHASEENGTEAQTDLQPDKSPSELAPELSPSDYTTSNKISPDSTHPLVVSHENGISAPEITSEYLTDARMTPPDRPDITSARLMDHVLRTTPSLLDHLYQAMLHSRDSDTTIALRHSPEDPAIPDSTVIMKCPGLLLTRHYKLRDLLMKVGQSNIFPLPNQHITITSPLPITQLMADICVWHICTDSVPDLSTADAYLEQTSTNSPSHLENRLAFAVENCIVGIVMGTLRLVSNGLTLLESAFTWESLDMAVAKSQALLQIFSDHEIPTEMTFPQYVEQRASKAAISATGVENDREVLWSLGFYLLHKVYDFIAENWMNELSAFQIDRAALSRRVNGGLPESQSLQHYIQNISDQPASSTRIPIVFGQMEPSILPTTITLSNAPRTFSAIALNLPLDQLQTLYQTVSEAIIEQQPDLSQCNDGFVEILEERRVRQKEARKDWEAGTVCNETLLKLPAVESQKWRNLIDYHEDWEYIKMNRDGPSSLAGIERLMFYRVRKDPRGTQLIRPKVPRVEI